MSATELAAWWGAGLATLVLGWDIYKWKTSTSPKLKLRAVSNMKILSSDDNKLYIYVTVANTGTVKTTLTLLIAWYYASRMRRLLRRRPTETMFVKNPGHGPVLPYVLGPGEQWTATINQEEELERLARAGYLYCGVHHSSSSGPCLTRVLIKPTKPTS